MFETQPIISVDKCGTGGHDGSVMRFSRATVNGVAVVDLRIWLDGNRIMAMSYEPASDPSRKARWSVDVARISHLAIDGLKDAVQTVTFQVHDGTPTPKASVPQAKPAPAPHYIADVANQAGGAIDHWNNAVKGPAMPEPKLDDGFDALLAKIGEAHGPAIASYLACGAPQPPAPQPSPPAIPGGLLSLFARPIEPEPVVAAAFAAPPSPRERPLDLDHPDPDTFDTDED